MPDAPIKLYGLGVEAPAGTLEKIAENAVEVIGFLNQENNELIIEGLHYTSAVTIDSSIVLTLIPDPDSVGNLLAVDDPAAHLPEDLADGQAHRILFGLERNVRVQDLGTITTGDVTYFDGTDKYALSLDTASTPYTATAAVGHMINMQSIFMMLDDTDISQPFMLVSTSEIVTPPVTPPSHPSVTFSLISDDAVPQNRILIKPAIGAGAPNLFDGAAHIIRLGLEADTLAADFNYSMKAWVDNAGTQVAFWNAAEDIQIDRASLEYIISTGIELVTDYDAASNRLMIVIAYPPGTYTPGMALPEYVGPLPTDLPILDATVILNPGDATKYWMKLTPRDVANNIVFKDREKHQVRILRVASAYDAFWNTIGNVQYDDAGTLRSVAVDQMAGGGMTLTGVPVFMRTNIPVDPSKIWTLDWENTTVNRLDMWFGVPNSPPIVQEPLIYQFRVEQQAPGDTSMFVLRPYRTDNLGFSPYSGKPLYMQLNYATGMTDASFVNAPTHWAPVDTGPPGSRVVNGVNGPDANDDWGANSFGGNIIKGWISADTYVPFFFDTTNQELIVIGMGQTTLPTAPPTIPVYDGGTSPPPPPPPDGETIADKLFFPHDPVPHIRWQDAYKKRMIFTNFHNWYGSYESGDGDTYADSRWADDLKVQTAEWKDPVTMGGFIFDAGLPRHKEGTTDWRLYDLRRIIRRELQVQCDGVVVNQGKAWTSTDAPTGSHQDFVLFQDTIKKFRAAEPEMNDFFVNVMIDFADFSGNPGPVTSDQCTPVKAANAIEDYISPTKYVNRLIWEGKPLITTYMPDRMNDRSWWEQVYTQLRNKGIQNSFTWFHCMNNWANRVNVPSPQIIANGIAEFKSTAIGPFGPHTAKAVDAWTKICGEASARGAFPLLFTAPQDMRPKTRNYTENLRFKDGTWRWSLIEQWLWNINNAEANNMPWMQKVTGTDFGESTHTIDSVANQYVMADLHCFFGEWFKLNRKPTIKRPGIYYIHRPMWAIDTGTFTKASHSYLAMGDNPPLANIIYALVFTDQPCTLEIQFGPVGKSFPITSVGNGIHEFGMELTKTQIYDNAGTKPKFRLKNSQGNSILTRNGNPLAELTSAFRIRKQPQYPDLLYRAGCSYRADVQFPLDHFPEETPAYLSAITAAGY